VNITSAITAGSPVECDVRMSTDNGTMIARVKMEYPKFRETVSAAGQHTTLISDGTYVYMNSPQAGTTWFRMPMAQMSSGISLDEIKNSLQQTPEGMVIHCRMGHVSDSEFQLPAGATVQDLSLPGTGGA
jgi:hypothetical protein